MKRLLIILSIFYLNSIFSQTNLTEKDVYAFFMKVYKHKPMDKTNNNQVAYGQYTWFDLYLYKFYNYEYNQVKNNEFKVQEFLNKVGNELQRKIWEADYYTVYTQTIKASFGKYDFSKKSFPVYYKLSDFKGANGFKGGFRINIDKIINENIINAELKMNSTDAENFINNRKQNNGNVNRDIFIKFYFKITPYDTFVGSPQGGVNGYNKEDLTIEVTKLEIFNNEYANDPIQKIVINNNKNTNPEIPSIEKIKSDLIGKRVRDRHSNKYWSFDYLGEFNKISILNSYSNSKLLDIILHLNLKSLSSSTRCRTNILLRYKLQNGNWQFNSLETLSFKSIGW